MTRRRLLGPARRWVTPVAVLVLGALSIQPASASGATSGSAATTADSVNGYGGLTVAQRADLMQIARDTWRFYSADVDPTTHLPLDNITFAGGSTTPTSYGRYTSASNVGVYLWAVVAAYDLELIGRPEARARIPSGSSRRLRT